MHVSKHGKLDSKHETFIEIFHSKEGFSLKKISHNSKNMIQQAKIIDITHNRLSECTQQIIDIKRNFTEQKL